MTTDEARARWRRVNEVLDRNGGQDTPEYREAWADWERAAGHRTGAGSAGSGSLHQGPGRTPVPEPSEHGGTAHSTSSPTRHPEGGANHA